MDPDTATLPRTWYHGLVGAVPNGVLVLFDSDLRYRMVGPETLPFSGRSAESMVGKTVDELFPEPVAGELRPQLEATIEGEPQSFDTEYDGQVHHIETRPVEIDGESFGVLITQEVTEARDTTEQLRRQNERLDQFASMVSHDLRNPIAIAKGRLELYQETGDREHLEVLGESLDRIETLTVDLMALARHRSRSAEVETFDIEPVAEAAWEMVDTRSATLETESGTLSGQPSQIQAALENLFRNAIGHGGDAVTVRVGPLSDGFYVEDTGDGIPEAEREAVFEHGFSTGYSGSGVGLTIVSRIAEANSLSVELAESPEGGARFEFHPVE